MAETIASLLVRIGANTDDLESAIQEAEQTLQDMGDRLTSIGAGLTAGVTAPLTGLGIAAGVVAGNVEEATNRIQAQLGITAQEAEELSDVAEAVWKNAFGENVREAGDAVATVHKNMQGITGEELKNATEAAFVLRDLFEYDINESTRAGKALMDNFGMTGEKAFDLITVAAQKGGDYSGELIDTISEYSTYFSAMGMQAEDMFNILIQGAQSGAWNLDKVGDAVKEFNIRAKDGSKTTAEGFAAIGLDAATMGEAIAKGGEEGKKAFMATIAALAAMKDPVQQGIAGVALFGTQWEDLESTVMTSLNPAVDVLGEVNGAAQNAGEVIHETFGARLTSVWREAQAALVPLGEILLDMAESVLPPLSKAIESASNWFSNLSPLGQKITVIMGIIAAAIGPVLMAIGTLTTAFATISLPVLGVVAGIAALAAIFAIAWAKSETFRNVVTTAFNKIKEIGMQVFGIVASFIGEKIAQIKAFWDENGPQFLQAVQNVFNGIKAVIDFVMPAVLFIIKAVWENIKGVINGALGIIMGVIKMFAGLFTGDFSKMWEGVKQLFVGAIEFVWNLISLMFVGRIVKSITAFGTTIWTSIKTMGTNVVNAFKGLQTGSVNIVTNMVNGIVNFFKNLFTNATNIFTQLRTFGANIWNSLSQAVLGVARNIWSGVTGHFSNLVNSAVNLTHNLRAGIVSIWNNILGYLRGINLVSIGKNIIQGLINGIGAMAGAVWNKVKEIASGIGKTIKNALSIKSPSRLTMQLGEYTGEGMIMGMEHTIGDINRTSLAMANAAVPNVNINGVGETISPSNDLSGFVQTVRDLVNRPISVQIDGQEIVSATIDGFDNAFSNRFVTNGYMNGVKG